MLIADRDFENRQKWEAGLTDVGGGKNVLITRYAGDPGWNGKTVAEIAALKKSDEITTVIEMIRAARQGIGVIVTAMSERISRRCSSIRSSISAPTAADRAGTPAATARSRAYWRTTCASAT